MNPAVGAGNTSIKKWNAGQIGQGKGRAWSDPAHRLDIIWIGTMARAAYNDRSISEAILDRSGDM
jgi:hypothetical protein